MRLVRAILVSLVIILAGTRAQAQPPSADYRLVWSDEFDGTRLDTAKWGFHQLGQRRKAINTPDCAALDGQGYLVLTTKRVGTEYHTAMIETRGKFQPVFGYFECRAKFQIQPGHWSAFWLQSPTLGPAGDVAKYGTEIDIFEFLGKQRDTLLMNLHWDGYGKDHKHAGSKHVDAALADGFHVVGLEWTPQEYVFYLDGKETWRTREGVSHAPEYIILSLEVDTWGGDISKAVLPDSFLVDYVRVYQKKPSDKAPPAAREVSPLLANN